MMDLDFLFLFVLMIVGFLLSWVVPLGNMAWYVVSLIPLVGFTNLFVSEMERGGLNHDR